VEKLHDTCSGFLYMILISHRGNTNGPDKQKENTLDQINKTLSLGFDVEIDIWCKDNSLFLGHDEAEQAVELGWIKENCKNLWVHCKNLEAIVELNKEESINYFWHQEDDFTLTSKNFIWTYPNKSVTTKSVIVCKDERSTLKYFKKNITGICSDYLEILNKT